MSHSRLIVALAPGADIEERLEKALAPFDENMAVEPYREYETGEPEAHWSWPKSEGADSGTNLPAVTWAQVAKAYNEKYPEDQTMHVDDDGRAFTLSTYNPKSKWDWYMIGGRYNNRWAIAAGFENDPAIIKGTPSWASDPKSGAPGWCDGGPVRMLDLAGMRSTAAIEAEERWHTFRKHAEQYPDTRGWEWYRAQVKAESMAIDDARTLYHGQPGIVALRTLESEFRYYEDPFTEFAVSLEDYRQQAEDGAVPGWALLTLDGEWWERGDMGWFGMSDATDDSSAEYRKRANAYIDGLDGDVVLLSVDVHI